MLALLLGAFGFYGGARILIEESRLGLGRSAFPLVWATWLRSAGLVLVGAQFLLFAYVGVGVARGLLWVWPLLLGIALMGAGSAYWWYIKRKSGRG